MAEEKDTDSAPDDGVTDSDAVTPSPRHGIGPASPGTPDSADERDNAVQGETADGESDDAGDETGLEVPAELREDSEHSEPQQQVDESEDEADEDNTDGDRELVGVGAAAKTGRSGSQSSGQVAKSTGRAKKDKPTPKQRTEAEKPKRTTPLEFVRGAISELKKVVYPTGSQLANYFVVVLVFVMLVIAIVTALDYGFGWAMLKVFS